MAPADRSTTRPQDGSVATPRGVAEEAAGEKALLVVGEEASGRPSLVGDRVVEGVPSAERQGVAAVGAVLGGERK